MKRFEDLTEEWKRGPVLDRLVLGHMPDGSFVRQQNPQWCEYIQ